MSKSTRKTSPTQPHAGEASPALLGTNGFEPLYTIRAASERAGLKYWLLLRAVNHGDVPSYQFSNKRRRVRLSDIELAITQSQAGRVM